MTPPRHTAIVAALAPLAFLYRLGVAYRNARFDRGRGVVRPAIPVISLGNLEAGGTGKTPMAVWLVEHLLRRGRAPAIVTRGYGGKAGSGPLDVGRGHGPLVGAETAGDEPVLLATTTGAIVVAGSDRVRGVARAAELGADVAVLDDGFQHRRLARDLDIVLLDAVRPFGNGRLLPAGPLREPSAALARAHVVVMTRWEDGEGPSGVEAVRALGHDAPIVRAIHRRRGFRDAAGTPAETPRRAVAFCGIARPHGFLEDLRAEGVEVVAFVPFSDHHRYSAGELARLVDRARPSEAALVTTMKDLARLGGTDAAVHPIALDVAFELLDPAPVEAAVDRVLGARR